MKDTKYKYYLVLVIFFSLVSFGESSDNTLVNAENLVTIESFQQITIADENPFIVNSISKIFFTQFYSKLFFTNIPQSYAVIPVDPRDKNYITRFTSSLQV